MSERLPSREPTEEEQGFSEANTHWFESADTVPLGLSERDRALHIVEEQRRLVEAQHNAELIAAGVEAGSKSKQPKEKVYLKKENPRLTGALGFGIAGAAEVTERAGKWLYNGADALLKKIGDIGHGMIAKGDKDLEKVFGPLKHVTTVLNWFTFGKLREKPGKTIGEVEAEEAKKEATKKKTEVSDKSRINKLVEGGMDRKQAEVLVKGYRDVETIVSDEREAEAPAPKPAP